MFWNSFKRCWKWVYRFIYMEHYSKLGTGIKREDRHHWFKKKKNNVSMGPILKSRVVMSIFLHRRACHRPDSGGFSALSLTVTPNTENNHFTWGKNQPSICYQFVLLVWSFWPWWWFWGSKNCCLRSGSAVKGPSYIGVILMPSFWDKLQGFNLFVSLIWL